MSDGNVSKRASGENVGKRAGGENATRGGFSPKQMGGAFERTRELDHYKIGSEKRPALLMVPDEKRKEEVEKICAENNWHCSVIVDKDQPEDVADLDLLQNPVETVRVEKSVGRNDSCPCGSGKKYKKCCGK